MALPEVVIEEKAQEAAEQEQISNA